ncbi:ABC transporter ATP-binding protein [Streptomyces sp. CB01881]|uniref:ATP-binding cassette domain-containing protein n=1 Tax=Streptomyces sp. CB01881 TaxID=2078691 RepID=UPI000CDC4B63|nr:ABC transporter ATP-binding protein [Streptomyces sp. CB01881]AUY51988.1 ABC transporter ATP-binding protein [Streptomyces sp. CB01881]TYC71418.1 ABC transporter ATP-binding protein [Streptomyces sp. CB01881]
MPRRPTGWTLALAVALPAEAATTLALPPALAGAVDAALDRDAGHCASALLALVVGTAAAANALAAAAGPACAAEATAGLRGRLVRHLLALGPGGRLWRDGPPPGDLAARLVGSAADAGGRLPAVLGAATALLTSAGAIVGLGVLSPWLALAFFGGVVPGVVLIRLFLREAGQVFVRYQEVQADLAARLTGALTGLRSIHAAGAQRSEEARVLEPLPALSAAGHALWAAQRRTAWQATLLIAVVEVAVLATAGALVAAGTLAPGALAAAAGWAALGAGLFEQVEALVGVAHARAGQVRVDELLALAPATGGAAVLPEGGAGELAFRGVVVRDGDRVLLGPLDLTVPGGCTVALVGRSGCGKSLLAALPGRLRDPDEGRVLVDGVPVGELAAPELRRAVGYAFERPALTGRTVRDALDGAGPAAVAAARADGFLRRLPAGWDTPLDELRLSGGELQRLGLARLLARPARVLVLDDATSGLDLATEYQITEALDRATHGSTRLVVAHRESAAARADLVAWLDVGRLRALAPHAELLADPDYRATLSGTALEAATA